jgi:S-adenosylmethionine hydrolase
MNLTKELKELSSKAFKDISTEVDEFGNIINNVKKKKLQSFGKGKMKKSFSSEGLKL